MVNSFTYDRLYTNIIYILVYRLMSLGGYQEQYNCQQIFFVICNTLLASAE